MKFDFEGINILMQLLNIEMKLFYWVLNASAARFSFCFHLNKYASNEKRRMPKINVCSSRCKPPTFNIQSHVFAFHSFTLIILRVFSFFASLLFHLKFYFISFNFSIFHQYSQEPSNNMSETISMWMYFASSVSSKRLSECLNKWKWNERTNERT